MTATLTEQRMAGLEKANDTRSDRAALKRELRALSPKDGARAVAAMVAENDERVVSMRAGILLACIARMSADSAENVLYECGVRFRARVQSLTVRQRLALVSRLERHSYHPAVRSSPKPKRAAPSPIPPRKGGPTCRCGEHLRKPGLCGFCAAEEAL